jgi:hypothetical protein
MDGYATGLACGIAIGIGCGMASGQGVSTKKIKALVADCTIRITDASGKSLTADELIALLSKKTAKK